ncbi:hypothetical protein, partial [uncultured Prevotella sp.]|uniref:hypothetical protein n=1 Tax=uncultured Prevotella sp. TaxID=159272 RepID=UPI00265CB82B
FLIAKICFYYKISVVLLKKRIVLQLIIRQKMLTGDNIYCLKNLIITDGCHIKKSKLNHINKVTKGTCLRTQYS